MAYHPKNRLFCSDPLRGSPFGGGWSISQTTALFLLFVFRPAALTHLACGTTLTIIKRKSSSIQPYLTMLENCDHESLLKAQDDLQNLQIQDKHQSKHQQGFENGAEWTQQAKHVTFLDLPFDIRFMIYKAFFGLQAFGIHEWQPYLKGFSNGTDTRSHAQNFHGVKPLLKSLASDSMRRVTAHNKVSLLLTSKSVLHEASTLLYQLHTFHVPTLGKAFEPPPEISISVGKVLNQIERIALVYETPVCDAAYEYRVIWHIALMLRCFPQLKELSVEFQLRIRSQFGEKIRRALQSAWPRLELLRVCVLHDKWNSCLNLSSIAPGFQWFKELEDGRIRPAPLPECFRPEPRKTTFLVDRRRGRLEHKGA